MTRTTFWNGMMFAASLALLCACGEKSSGPMQIEVREVGTFNAIDMEGAARLEIAIGDESSVQVEAPADVLERVKTEVREGTLFIESRFKDWISRNGGQRVTLKISLPALTSLRLGGGNDVQLEGFAGGESSIKVEGAAHIEASGTLEQLTVHMAGAGHADFSDLVSDRTRVTVDGVGSVIVHPKETLDATMNGIGAILYTGTPREVSTRMNGLGTIAKSEEDHSPTTEDEQVEIDPDTLQPEYEDNAWKKRGETEVI